MINLTSKSLQDYGLTEMETHWSSEPDGNLMMNFDPVFSSVSLRGRNLQTTLMESSVAASAAACAWLSLSSPMVMISCSHCFTECHPYCSYYASMFLCLF